MRVNARLLSALALVVLFPGACLFSQTTSTFKFSAPHVVPLGTSPNATRVQYVASGDVNGDGNTDLLTVINSNPELLLGNGKGGFTEKLVTNAVFPGVDINSLLLDVNGDGHADYISTYGGGFDKECNETPGSLNVFLGDGKGNFSAGPTYQTSQFSHGNIAVGDFNHDGKPDLALLSYSTEDCSNSHQSMLIVYLNNGHGGFTPVFGPNIAGFFTDNLVTGDFNGDGHLDLAYTVTSGSLYPEIATLDGNGDGSFRAGPGYVVEGGAGQLAAGDLNGDKRADLVVNAGARNATGAQPKIASLLAKVTGGFYWHSALSYSQALYPGYQLVDLNGSGKLDLLLPFASSASPTLFTTKVSAGDGTGTFQNAQTLISQTTYGGAIAVPLTTKGLPAIVLFLYVPSKAPSIEVLLNESK